MTLEIPPLMIDEIPTYRVGEARAHISKAVRSDLGFESTVMARMLLSMHYEQPDIHDVNMHSIRILNQENFDAVITVIYYMYKHNKKPIDLYGAEFMRLIENLYSLHDHKILSLLDRPTTPI